MDIYSSYIFFEKLVSPLTGYSCKVITKQNVKQFGFSTIDELHLMFPNFPLVCKSLSLKRSEKAKKEHSDGHNTKIKTNRIEREKREYIPKLCKKCNKEIEFRFRKNLYCSRSCANSRVNTEETNTKRKSSLKSYYKKIGRCQKFYTITCSFCGCRFERNKKPNSKSGIYCCKSDSCKAKLLKQTSAKGASKGGKASAAKRVKRSKQEIELYNMLSKHFKNIGNNVPIANGWDADILLYDYKIAILWNGPWHYREMGFGNHSLNQVVNRDCIKIQEFETIGWKCLIYQDNEWSPMQALVDVLLEARG